MFKVWNEMLGTLEGNRWHLVLALKSLGIMPALGRAGGPGTGHMLSHPCELQVAKEIKLEQLN